MTSVSCSVGNVTETNSTSCVLEGPGYLVMGFDQTPLWGDPQAIVGAIASVEAETTFPPPVQISVSAEASETEMFYTAGKERPGFIQFDVEMESSGAGDSEATITDGVHQYSFSCHPGSLYGCSFQETMPFDLGSSFELSVSGSIQISGLFDPGEFAFGGPGALVQSVSLFEADGTTPAAFALAPEPSAWGLLLAGLAVVILARREMRHSGSRSTSPCRSRVSISSFNLGSFTALVRPPSRKSSAGARSRPATTR